MNDDIKHALEVLQNGGIILYPTDTIWGIGCDATNEQAVKKIFKLKEREDTKSMLVLVDMAARIPQYVDIVPEIAWDLVEISGKPLTIIYPGAKNLANNLVAEDGSIGIRVVKDEFCIKLISRFKKPVVSTSANYTGTDSPKTFYEIDSKIIEGVDYVVNWRQDDVQPANPSSIIKLGIHNEIKVLRK